MLVCHTMLKIWEYVYLIDIGSGKPTLIQNNNKQSLEIMNEKISGKEYNELMKI